MKFCHICFKCSELKYGICRKAQTWYHWKMQSNCSVSFLTHTARYDQLCAWKWVKEWMWGATLPCCTTLSHTCIAAWHVCCEDDDNFYKSLHSRDISIMGCPISIPILEIYPYFLAICYLSQMQLVDVPRSENIARRGEAFAGWSAKRPFNVFIHFSRQAGGRPRLHLEKQGAQQGMAHRANPSLSSSSPLDLTFHQRK